ncbi:MAG: endopeptidase La, partial [Lentisphaeria bacterium]|nr:endopeptidase La [Lentisphaeria bacterium]
SNPAPPPESARASNPAVRLFELRDQVLYPFSLTPVPVSEENSAALKAAMADNRLLAIFPEVPERAELGNFPLTLSLRTFEFRERTRSAIGVLVRVVKELTFPDGSRKAVLRGVKRIQCSQLRIDERGVVNVGYQEIPVIQEPAETVEARRRSVMLGFQELAGLSQNMPEELQMAVLNAPSAGRFADTVADALSFSTAEKVVLLSQCSVVKRLEILSLLINRELEVLRLGVKIQNEVHEAMSQSQREYFLREQLRTIQRELGEETANPDVAALRKRLNSGDYPEEVLTAVENELERLELIPQSAPEYHISYNYMSLLLDLPWTTFTEDVYDIDRAAKVLDEDHYGLEEVKKRILEFLAVMQLRHERGELCRAPILCLVGPPGVGKTSIGRSIARAMGRKFIRVSLGGVRDEAEIRGHRRTYVGAMPGRIIKSLKRVGSGNPVFMLDEVDKLAHDFRGDPASALLEVLDPEQNNSFADNDVELAFDLSTVFFIATANDLEGIPGPLRDRMEIIRLPGYTTVEKREIAKRYLLPRQVAESGLEASSLRVPLPTLDYLIENYTMEAGVRELERVCGKLCRRLVRRRLEDPERASAPVRVDVKLAHEILGVRIFRSERSTAAFRAPGYAIGMAWTGVGGVVLPVEAALLPGGKGDLKLTGSLGKVMQESAAAAFTLVRSLSPELGIAPEVFTGNDFHIHVPDGATPKDGPSAGVTMVSVLTSLLLKRALRPHLSMTGEITLQGRVTAIGGVREKVVAALRAGITDVVMPRDNAEEYGELPESIRSKLNAHFVANCRELLKTVFDEPVLKNPERHRS